MKRKALFIWAALYLLLTTLTSALAFGYFEANSTPYVLLIAATLLFGGMCTACIGRLLSAAK